MDKDKFTGITTPVWWLLEAQLAPDDLKEKRKELGKSWGWEDEGWFAQPEKIAAVYDFLYPRYQTLLDELDTQIVDVYVRTKWIDDLLKAKADAAKQAAAETAAPPAPTTAPPPASQPAAKQAEAPKKASAFGRMKTAEETPGAQPADSGATAGAAAGTTAAAAGTTAPAEPKKPSPFARKSAAPEAPAGTPPPPTETAASTAGTAAGTESVEQIKASLSELVADPSVPIDQREADQLLRDPDFAQHLAEAESAIEAELEAELAAAEAQR